MISACVFHLENSSDNHLMRCIDNIRHHVHEIIVFLSKSSSCIEMQLSEYNIQYYVLPSNLNCIDLRNWSISHAKHENILLMDSNEIIDKTTQETLPFIEKTDYSQLYEGLWFTKYSYLPSGKLKEEKVLRLISKKSLLEKHTPTLHHIKAEALTTNFSLIIHHFSDTCLYKNRIIQWILWDCTNIEPDAMIYLEAMSLANSGQLDKGISALQRYIDTNAESEKIYQLLGKLWLEKNEIELAEKALLRVFRLGAQQKKKLGTAYTASPYYTAALNNFAEIEAHRENFHLSIAFCKKAIMYRAETYSYINMAVYLQQVGEYEAAQKIQKNILLKNQYIEKVLNESNQLT